MRDKILVMLSTEGTYPFHQGGVSTWCDILVKKLVDVDYVVYSILMDPFVTQKFALPSQTGLVKMPLWGTEEPSEHLSTPFSQNYLAKKRTTRKIVREQFIPLFCELIEEIIAIQKDPHRLARIMLALHLYFEEYDYKESFKAEETWETYKQIIFRHHADGANKLARPDLYCLIQSLGWVYRFMNILNTPVPDVHVTHSSAAAFCGIPCVLAKMKNGTPFLLTEHGIYLREQYLSIGKREYSSYLNTFLVRLVLSITSLNYTFADQVSPVCQYNTRWETRFQVPPERIQVIYNGVDKNVFVEAPHGAQERPTVVTVARIDPLKDILTLIKAAAMTKAKIPDVKFIIYGSVSVPSYYEECLALREQLELTETVIFAGHTSNMSAAYQSGDVIALTSISEAFPYSVVEAMMTGKPCISTDVGGIREALGETGILVNPRDFEALSEGLVKLLKNPDLRAALGQEGRERALSYFTLERVLELHWKSYVKLALGASDAALVQEKEDESQSRESRLHRQRVLAEKAYSFMAGGQYRDAIRYFNLALMEEPGSPSSPVLLMEIAESYNQLGEFDKVFATMEKQAALAYLIEHRSA
ncbi:GT4 family glycosyltransferase PelF [Paenibacillus hamazuiensis]|uniref:GT4 family glycosyltransferase PelF n=1 Tax=Paenibacillus hamazuiensis TaxID=2936508 RepID=UPI00201020EA|nr:GT4 family glycosyltransferase PelF [Paenibacillus hamazuiensis]